MAPVVLLVMALLITGAVYAAVTSTPARAAVATQTDVDTGGALFRANCATCHGIGAQGGDGPPSPPLAPIPWQVAQLARKRAPPVSTSVWVATAARAGVEVTAA